MAEKAEAETKPGKVFKDCTDCPEMVAIPAGNFEMGSNSDETNEKPVHRVTIGHAFAMGKTEVTQKQWRAVMGNNPGYFSNCDDDCPVERVSWNDAQDFLRKLGAKTGKTYRLPSEAEWEYACRAGGAQKYCGGNNADSVAWYDRNSKQKTHSVAAKQANAIGLYDMSGNVWEWVADCYHVSYDGAPADGSAWTSGCSENRRVLRGGSWDSGSRGLRAAVRYRFDASYRSNDFGLRPVRALP